MEDLWKSTTANQRFLGNSSTLFDDQQSFLNVPPYYVAHCTFYYDFIFSFIISKWQQLVWLWEQYVCNNYCALLLFLSLIMTVQAHVPYSRCIHHVHYTYRRAVLVCVLLVIACATCFGDCIVTVIYDSDLKCTS